MGHLYLVSPALQTLFRNSLEDAGLPGLRIYDLRHAGLTRMAEAGAPVHVMMAFAGHMSMRMQRHYVAISMASKSEWAERIWGADEGDALPPKKGAASVRVLDGNQKNYRIRKISS